MQSFKQLVRKIKQDTYAIYLASIDPRVPWYTRLLAVCVVAYAFSPIDLIPDFIPILGYLDDLVILPCGIWLLIKIIPPDILADCREKATAIAQKRPQNWVAGSLIILLWFLLGMMAVIWVKRIFNI